MVLFNQNVAKYCSMKVGGNAAEISFPSDTDSLIADIEECKSKNIRFIVLGNASDVIIPDSGFDGRIIFTSALKKIYFSDNRCTAEAGVSLTALATAYKDKSFSGFEFAYGIPGTVGGAVYMNAGAYGGEIKDLIVSALCYDCKNSKIVVIDRDGLLLGYRRSILQNGNGLVLLSATFRTVSGERENIESLMEENMKKRRHSQPLEYPSCGSAFKRPVGYYAAALIEECGLKGMRVGGAQVSEKHAGFIINIGNATATDVTELIKTVQKTVLEKKGVIIEPEIIVIT